MGKHKHGSYGILLQLAGNGLDTILLCVLLLSLIVEKYRKPTMEYVVPTRTSLLPLPPSDMSLLSSSCGWDSRKPTFQRQPLDKRLRE